MMQKNLISRFSYLAAVDKYTKNPHRSKRQERDSNLYDVSAERKNEKQQKVFFNRCKLLISRGVNSATRITNCPNWQGVDKILTKTEPKRTSNVTTKIRFFFTKHGENLQAYK